MPKNYSGYPTTSEIKFIDGLGLWGLPTVMSDLNILKRHIKLLRKYQKCLPLRTVWGMIDKETVEQYIRARIRWMAKLLRAKKPRPSRYTINKESPQIELTGFTGKKETQEKY